MSERESLLPDIPIASRSRIERALGTWGSVELRCEWTAIMRWEDEMLAFANQAAERADALGAALRDAMAFVDPSTARDFDRWKDLLRDV